MKCWRLSHSVLGEDSARSVDAVTLARGQLVLAGILIKTSPVILTSLNHIWIESVVKLCRAERDVYVRNAMAPSAIRSYRRSPPCCLVRAQAQSISPIPYPAGNGSIDVFPVADDCPTTRISVVAGNVAGPDGFSRVTDCRSTFLAEFKQ
jgi:hypothetical protein